jgi:hypothetical protein
MHHAGGSMEEQIVEEESYGIMEEDSWRRIMGGNDGEGIVVEESWVRSHGGRIMERGDVQESHQGGIFGHVGNTLKHLGSLC